MKKIFDFGVEIEFYLKIALICSLMQQLFYWLLHNRELSFIAQVVLYWLVSSVSFHGIGFIIEKGIKRNAALKEKLSVRVKKVKQQTFPALTVKAFMMGEAKGFAMAFIVIALVPEVNRGNSFLPNFGWFLMSIISVDLFFYICHSMFHRIKFLRKFHLKHHQFADTSSFVAGHKSMTEFIVTNVADLMVIFVFGYDITQLCAWTVIGNAYNLEGHSSLSLFFISSDFHDLHHTCYKGNYGVQGFWDKVFNTLNTPTKKPGLMFPMAALEHKIMKPIKKSLESKYDAKTN